MPVRRRISGEGQVGSTTPRIVHPGMAPHAASFAPPAGEAGPAPTAFMGCYDDALYLQSFSDDSEYGQIFSQPGQGLEAKTSEEASKPEGLSNIINANGSLTPAIPDTVATSGLEPYFVPVDTVASSARNSMTPSANSNYDSSAPQVRAQLHGRAGQKLPSSTSQRSHVPQQQGWRGNPHALQPQAQTSGSRSLANAARAFHFSPAMAGFSPSSMTHQPADYATQVQPRARHAQYPDTSQQQASQSSTRHGFGDAASSAPTELYQKQVSVGRLKHAQSYNAPAFSLQYPMSPNFDGNFAAFNGYYAPDCYPSDPLSDPGFSTPYAYGQCPPGMQGYAPASYAAPTLAPSDDQASSYSLPRVHYPPPEVAAHPIPPYGNVHSSDLVAQQSPKVIPDQQSPRGELDGINSHEGPRSSAREGGREPREDSAGGEEVQKRDLSRSASVEAVSDAPSKALAPAPRVPLAPPRGHLRAPEPWISPDGRASRPDWAKNGRVSSDRKKMRNNDKECDPKYYYHTLRVSPQEFGPTTGGGCTRYTYKAGVQLAEGRSFSKEELGEFLRGRAGGEPCTLRVQGTPSQITKRLDKDDRRCRWDCCPIDTRTIGPGWYRVGFDEFPEWTSDGTLDPYKMAGMMHLWCFEQCFNIVKFHREGRLAAENRSFPKEEKNAAALTRDTDREIIQKAYLKWFEVREAEEKGRSGSGAWKPREHADTLSYALTQHHLDHQTPARQNSRCQRNRNKKLEDKTTIDYHMGDLGKFAEAATSVRETNRERKREVNRKRAEAEVEFLGGNAKSEVEERKRGARRAARDAARAVMTNQESAYDLVEMGAEGGGRQEMARPEGFNPLAHFVERQVPSVMRSGGPPTPMFQGGVEQTGPSQGSKRRREDGGEEAGEAGEAKRARPSQGPPESDLFGEGPGGTSTNGNEPVDGLVELVGEVGDSLWDDSFERQLEEFVPEAAFADFWDQVMGKGPV